MLGQSAWFVVFAALFVYVAEIPPARGDDLPPLGGPVGAYAPSAAVAPGPVLPAPVAAAPAGPALLDGSVSTTNVGRSFEGRFGAFYHGFGSAEHDTYDLNGSILSPRLNVGLPGYWAYFMPQFQIGGAVNLDHRTSFAYAGIAMTLPLTRWLLFEPFLGGAVDNGSLTPTATLSGLGCPVLFHAGTSVGIPIDEHWQVLATFEHLSNGRGIFGVNCGTNELPGGNQGLNNVGVSVGYAF
jgi:lipid A 3-O-deacylase